MKAYQDVATKFDRLLRPAEELIQHKANTDVAPFSDDPLELIHELRIHQAEPEIQNEERLRVLFEYIPIAYQSLEAEGHIVQVNTAWETMPGYAKMEVIGKSFSKFILPEERDRFIKQFARQRSVGEILGPEFVLFKKG